MRRASTGFAAVTVACGLLSGGGAHALGTLSSGEAAPVEQRVALAVGPDRTTLWTSVRVSSSGGALGIVAPAPPGAALDWSSSAWFEALEVATAPRVLAPPLDCGGEAPEARLDIVGEMGHEVPLPAGGVAILADAAAVETWAAENGLTLPPALGEALATYGAGQRFVAARFDAPAGTVLTPTLRIVSPTAVPELPLVLTRAGDEELLVTTFVLGEGRAQVDGAPVAAINRSGIRFRAASGASTYDEARAAALAAAGPGSTLIESAGHASLAGTIALPEGAGSIDGVADVYFDRASAYGDALGAPATCTAQASSIVGAAARVSAACPRAALGVVDGTDTCTEAVGAGEADPELLRCGITADDLAVALSGQSPASSWLTRHVSILAPGQSGARASVSLPPGPEQSPVIEAPALACEVPLRQVEYSGCGCSGTQDAVIIGVVEVIVVDDDDEDDVPYAYTQEEDCEGDTSDPYATDTEGEPVDPAEAEAATDDGGCSGDSSDTGTGGDYTVTETSSDAEGSEDDGGCGSDTSDTASDSESSDDGGCGSDTSDTGSDSESSDDGGCSSDTSDTGESDGSSGGSSESEGSSDSNGCNCDSTGSGSDGSSSNCTVAAPKKRVKRVRLSVLAYAALALLAPLRRARRPKRGAVTAPGTRG